jgi:CRP-like cAMP-binding protein
MSKRKDKDNVSLRRPSIPEHVEHPIHRRAYELHERRGSSVLDLATLRRNRILAALSSDEQLSLARHLRLVSMDVGDVLLEPDAPIRSAYFVTKGMACSLVDTGDGRSVGTDLIGYEGFVGTPLLLECNSMTGATTVMQIAGSALKIPADALREFLGRPGELQALLKRYILQQLTRVTQTAACNRLHSTDERLARWLLMTSDRVGVEFRLTHEMMAHMIGSRRVSLTLRARELQQAGIIDYRYGRLRILSRTRLERAACECYRIQREQYDGFLR